MKLIFVIVLAFAPSLSNAQVDVNREDHQKHLAVSAAGTLALSQAMNSQLGALVVMNLVGAFKEYAVDASPDPTDMEANAVGSLMGAGLHWSF